MIPLKPLANLPTHEVTNMPPHLGDQDLWLTDAALREGVAREGGFYGSFYDWGAGSGAGSDGAWASRLMTSSVWRTKP